MYYHYYTISAITIHSVSIIASLSHSLITKELIPYGSQHFMLETAQDLMDFSPVPPVAHCINQHEALNSCTSLFSPVK